ncbi:hypothetical protein ACTMTU_02940 [Streptomyces sp. OZ13]
MLMHDRSSQSTIAEFRDASGGLGVPLVMLYLVAGWFCWTALTIRPSGP